MTCVFSVGGQSGDCVVSLTVHDGNNSASAVLGKFCSTVDDRRPQSIHQPATLNFTSSGSWLTIALRGQHDPTTTLPISISETSGW